jgi:1,4-dihydroxy-2-naphthoyl-CoA hydrolase
MSDLTDLTGVNALMALLEIQFEEISATRVRGSAAADERHHQPWGIVHGGLYTTVIETFATTGAYEAAKDRGQQPSVSPTPPTSSAHTAADDSTLFAVPTIKDERSSSGRWRCRPEEDKLVARGQVRLQNIEATPP